MALGDVLDIMDESFPPTIKERLRRDVLEMIVIRIEAFDIDFLPLP